MTISRLKQYDFIVFDCDGVILDSNEMKSKAFSESVKHEESALIEQFLTYHKSHGGVSRYKKFDYFFHHIKKESEDIQQQYDAALTEYTKIVKKGLIECPYISGVIKTVECLNEAGVPLYVVSGSDEKELIDVFQRRGIAKQFHAIFGSPKNKVENLVSIQKLRGSLDNGLVIGDSKSDMLAAEHYNLDFIYIYGKSEWTSGLNTVKDKGYAMYKNLLEILNGEYAS